jgi:hypothetical protein
MYACIGNKPNGKPFAMNKPRDQWGKQDSKERICNILYMHYIWLHIYANGFWKEFLQHHINKFLNFNKSF